MAVCTENLTLDDSFGQSLRMRFSVHTGRIRLRHLGSGTVPKCSQEDSWYYKSVFHRNEIILSHIGLESTTFVTKSLEEAPRTLEAAMRLFLLGMLVVLTPSMLAVAWLLWRADGSEEASRPM